MPKGVRLKPEQIVAKPALANYHRSCRLVCSLARGTHFRKWGVRVRWGLADGDLLGGSPRG